MMPPRTKQIRYNGYIGLTEDFQGREGFSVDPIDMGLCVITKYPEDFHKTVDKVIQVYVNLTYYDMRANVISNGRILQGWDLDEGFEDPLKEALCSIGLTISPDFYSPLNTGLGSYIRNLPEERISL